MFRPLAIAFVMGVSPVAAPAVTLDLADYGMTSFSYRDSLTGPDLVSVTGSGVLSDPLFNLAVDIITGILKPKDPGGALPANFSIKVIDTPGYFKLVMGGGALPTANSGLNQFGGAFVGKFWDLPTLTLLMKRPNNAFRDLVTIGGTAEHKIDPDEPAAGGSDTGRFSVNFFTATNDSERAERDDSFQTRHSNGHFENWTASLGGTTGRDVVFERNRIVEFSFVLEATHIPLPPSGVLLLAPLAVFAVRRAPRKGDAPK